MASIARAACAARLQKISDIPAESCSLFIAAGASASHSASHLNVRIRLRKSGQLRTLHLLAAPMEGSHAGKRMRGLFSKAMGAIAVGWRERLVEVSTDEAPNALGARQGFTSRAKGKVALDFAKHGALLAN